MTKKYTIGDYTNCRYDICEILEDGDFFCVVGTDYVRNIINVLEENEQLKQDKKRLIGYLHRYGKVDIEDIDEIVLNQEYLDEWGDLYD